MGRVRAKLYNRFALILDLLKILAVDQLTQQEKQDNAAEYQNANRADIANPVALQVFSGEYSRLKEKRSEGAKKTGVKSEKVANKIEHQDFEGGHGIAILLPATRAEFPIRLQACTAIRANWEAAACSN